MEKRELKVLVDALYTGRDLYQGEVAVFACMGGWGSQVEAPKGDLNTWKGLRRVVRTGFHGWTVKALEEWCLQSYRLGSNPLKHLRGIFPGAVVSFVGLRTDEAQTSFIPHPGKDDKPGLEVRVFFEETEVGSVPTSVEIYFLGLDTQDHWVTLAQGDVDEFLHNS